MVTSGKNGQGGGVRQPARRPKVSAKVYRRRRQVAAALAVLVLAALVAGGIGLAGLIASRGSGKSDGVPAAAAPAATTQATQSPANPVAKPGTPASGVCDEAGIKVGGTVDKTSYPSGQDPKLTLKVTNTGKSPCDINVGTSQMEFKVTSGDDTVFNSRDCQAESTDLVKNLRPGASETATFTWKRNRTAPGCAKGTSTAVSGGGATYVFVATLGKWSSDKVVFTLK
ncbi:hypothetical protein AL755_00900 (plasmid) [Arthrobacter sp. ERGS1:01]|uniref:hypothetical protein n=1 Tax=Arthrobacter sp. ERGS1:01 TaxID=1704044 RepID=UPI0006CB58A2|nr:hypothetical protein [Arthrobacter sp. ERGS1:01]ALE04297.1 hypothetical protein AL755_00900 [Arthrobacter sp. ERGS1:01]